MGQMLDNVQWLHSDGHRFRFWLFALGADIPCKHV